MVTALPLFVATAQILRMLNPVRFTVTRIRSISTSYYAIPEEPGTRAYTLLLETMQKTGYAAIAKVGMHQREYIVVIRPREQGLTLHTMYYPNEVRAVPEYGHLGKVEIRSQEIQLAEQLVKSLASAFEPQK
jgi:DNA end-binding protein Ku